MGKEKGDERSDRERQEREIQKCIQRLKFEPGCFPLPLGDAYCCSKFDYLRFLYQMNPHSLLEKRTEPNEWAEK